MYFAQPRSLERFTGRKDADSRHSLEEAKKSLNIGNGERLVSALGGAGLVVEGLRRRSIGGLLLAIGGAEMIRRGVTGHCELYGLMGLSTRGSSERDPSEFYNRGIHVEESITIQKPVSEVYRFWHNFENLPQFMDHLDTVDVYDDKRSRWVAKAPIGMRVEWDAEIINDQENKLIAWKSLPGADVDNRGSVRFLQARGGRGTEVRVSIEYIPPAGRIGAAIARLFGENPQQQVRDDLRRLREILEAGETSTTQGQPSGRARRGAIDNITASAGGDRGAFASVDSSESGGETGRGG